jgi:predicted cation transporter
MLIAGLTGIIFLVLVLPLIFHKVEENLEVFLFVMGLMAVTVSHFFSGERMWSFHLVKEAISEPLKITLSVLIAGFLFKTYRAQITERIVRLEHTLGPRVFGFTLVVSLGLASSIITAIISALILVEVISALNLDKRFETNLTIIACFSIGLGAALTPVGEPLSTIAIAKLKGEPHHAGFFFLFKLLGPYIIPGVIFLGIMIEFFRGKETKRSKSLVEDRVESNRDVLLRAGKVYLFVVALVFLGEGFKPVIDMYIINLHPAMLYWINMISAVLDNATLTAAEISPKMTIEQIDFILMGLLISGGMLIPGNIPNIISASKLKIKSREWARLGVPLGLGLMLIYFIIFELVLR